MRDAGIKNLGDIANDFVKADSSFKTLSEIKTIGIEETDFVDLRSHAHSLWLIGKVVEFEKEDEIEDLIYLRNQIIDSLNGVVYRKDNGKMILKYKGVGKYTYNEIITLLSEVKL